MGKKRKLNQTEASAGEIDTTKPSAVFVPKGGRSSTLSIAIPGSVIANAVSHDQKNNLAGTVARALAVFSVDEVVIFSDDPPSTKQNQHYSTPDGSKGYTGYTDPTHFLSHLLSYLETPPYLRKALFPMHPDLKTAGSLPSLDMPHHSKNLPSCPYREGVTKHHDPNQGTFVDVGLESWALLPDTEIPPRTRITLKSSNRTSNDSFDFTTATAVAPETPRVESGFYWGYNVRTAPNLSSVFTESPFPDGYDLTIGTSERGDPINTTALFPSSSPSSSPPPPPPSYTHLLLLLGGPSGLEHAAKSDPALTSRGITPNTVSTLFDFWINVLPGQGSRTIRSEEAVWLGLMALREFVDGNERRLLAVEGDGE